jgi:hypothetical protein
VIRYWPDGAEVSPETEFLLDRIVFTARTAARTVAQRSTQP